MAVMELSDKGKELVELYERMAEQGYERADHTHVEVAFSDFELRPYRASLRACFQAHSISTVLDYGCGGSDWELQGFDEGTQSSAIDYFGLDEAYRYEPARNIDERQPVDCVVSFDVLEHVFVSDVPKVIRDMFSYAKKLLILNVACYPAAARLPNGENAHITVRPPLWWKGMLDGIAPEYPDVSVLLICSTSWRESSAFPIWSGGMWQQSGTFVVEL
jgi:hypothetical protein